MPVFFRSYQFLYFGLLLATIVAVSSSVLAEEPVRKAAALLSESSSIRYRLDKNSELQDDNQSASRRHLRSAREILEDTAHEVGRIFQLERSPAVSLFLLSPKRFASVTGGADWTQAMYARQTIFLRFSTDAPRKKSALRKSIRHEYMHAATDALSGSSCPAWLDEGLAQIFEGAQRQWISAEFRRALRANQQMFDLRELDGGFTALDKQAATFAYGQSLFAARSIVNRFGYSSVRAFLDQLKQRQAFDIAFENAFSLKFTDFQKQLESQATRWQESDQLL